MPFRGDTSWTEKRLPHIGPHIISIRRSSAESMNSWKVIGLLYLFLPGSPAGSLAKNLLDSFYFAKIVKLDFLGVDELMS